jgi:Tol biopolymer transport system component
MRIGAYEVLAKLGEGGMGEVYRARDTNLGRDVAIKVLPDAFAQDAERLARFEREARTLASLNHPHIAIVHGLEHAGGLRAIVMELVEGPTLADRLAQGAIPLDEALPIAKQIAEALEAAHEQGVIHRDLKPANVKVRPDGTVKVLDFGLAKALGSSDDGSASRSSPALTNSPTLMSPLGATGVGVILGTAAYMAPEQAKGRSVSKATDVWAFGCVLYEMLTGRAVFTGDDLTEVLASVVRAEPDWSVLPRDLPAPISRLLRRCLQKDRRNRLADLGDARLELDDALHGPREEISGEQTTTARRQRILLLSAVAAATLVSVGAVVWAMQSRAVATVPLLQLQVVPPQDVTFPYGIPHISPDGRVVAFIGIGRDGVSRVYVRPLDTVEARPLAGTEGVRVGGSSPIWSPDSRQLAFQVDTTLKKITVGGGLSQSLCDLGKPIAIVGGSWNRDGTVIFGTNGRTGLFRVTANGGTCEPLTRIEPSESNHLFPVFLPDGRHFLYLRDTNDRVDLYVGSLDAPPERQKVKQVLQTDHRVQYQSMPGERVGRLLFVRDATLFAQPFDPDRFELSGDAVPLAGNIGTLYHLAYFSASTDGTLVYRTAASNDMQLTWFDRDGKVVSEVGDPMFPTDLFVSRDGSQVTYASLLPPYARWLMDLRRGTRRRLDDQGNLTWSPDGQYLALKNQKGLYRRRVNSDEGEELLLDVDAYVPSLDWSRDGRFIVYVAVDRGPHNPQASFDIWALPLDGTRKPFAVARTASAEFDAKLSPDGRWVAYISDESGSNEIYVRRFVPPSTSPSSETAGSYGVTKSVVTSILGWRNDGTELWYLTPDFKIMSVALSLGPAFQAREPKMLFEMPPGTRAQATDGDRFLLAVPTRQSLQVPIIVVQNWPTLMNK